MAKKLSFLLAFVFLVSLVAGAVAQDEKVTFMSTQFNVVEETDKARTILADFGDGTADFVPSEEGPMIELILAEASAGEGTVDLLGALHGTFPTLANNDTLFDLSELLAEIEADTDVTDAFVELGKLGTDDYQYYIPWMQATFTMAAHNEALQYLPEGADINALTWAQLAEWAKNIQEATGEARLGLPVAGLFHRFLEGYAFPSWTGGMVTGFKTQEAADMLVFMRDELWPYVNPESINYEFMSEPLLSGEVWIAFDHVARLKAAFDEQPENFIAFPAPAGPAGRGYMPVVVGLAVPYTSPNPDGADELIKYLLSPEVQGEILRDLGFYPVVSGVDTSNLPEGVALQSAAVEAQANSPDGIPSLLPVGLGDRGGEINQIFRNAFTRVVLEGQDPMTVLEEEGAALQTLLDETGAACWVPDPPSDGPCQLR
ncbi:MAG: ABC transporter substrate-binding protein [Anaerolineae bacterium]|nr:ABC transporter substrate-binding protein [Anaerolineae bacterium]